ncbi:MAG: hypothetical protein M3478_07400 [Planctomycetota bacterium]|nr:hypothetical protein [Planctomycetota bacterium]
MSDEMRPAKLWRSLPTDVKVAAAAAFWNDEQAALEQAEAVALIAKQIKFRPKSVITLSADRKAKHLAGMAQVSDLLAARLFVAYHLQHQRPMMGRFLDLLGIAHADGLISEESPTAPEADKLDAAAAALASEFPKADVARYFWTLLWQDPETWSGLQGRAELTAA